MTRHRKDIDAYKIWYRSAHDYLALIECFDKAEFAGMLVFYDDGVKLPANKLELDCPVLHFPIKQFNDIITTLRYEKPIFIMYNSENGAGTVGTAELEPVGEQEGSG